ncbi:helix-turn-helix domain-containing protein [Nocardiaceae bacterium NPDC056970]
MNEYLQLLADLHAGGEAGKRAAKEVFAAALEAHPEHTIAFAMRMLTTIGTPNPEPPRTPAADERIAYKLAEAAELVGVSRDTMRLQMFSGMIGAVQLGPRMTLIPRTELVRWINDLPAWEPRGDNYARGPIRPGES